VHVEKQIDYDLEIDSAISEIPAPIVSQTRLKRWKGIPPTLRSRKGEELNKKVNIL
jgi:hypothetical protein